MMPIVLEEPTITQYCHLLSVLAVSYHDMPLVLYALRLIYYCVNVYAEPHAPGRNAHTQIVCFKIL